MPRLMSVSHTEYQVHRRAKTVTRRAGWAFLNAGDRVTLVRKAMGLRPGDQVERIVDVEVVDVRREQLQEITQADVAAEGFPDWTRDQFLDFFCDSMGGTGLQEVTRIQYRYLEPVADTIEKAIAGWRFMYGDEKALQNGIEIALTRAGLQVEREVSLNPRGRIDFLVQTSAGGRRPRTGLEVKVAGSVEAVMRQLQCYAPHVDDLVLVTTKARHAQLPALVGHKACRVVPVRGGAW